MVYSGGKGFPGISRCCGNDLKELEVTLTLKYKSTPSVPEMLFPSPCGSGESDEFSDHSKAGATTEVVALRKI